MTFKIGDRVRMRRSEYQVVPVGAEGEISEANTALPFPYRVKWDSHTYVQNALYLDGELEAI